MTDSGFAHIADDAVPALAVLLGPEAEDVLSTVVEPQGGTLRSTKVTQIRYTPARSIVVTYQADVAWTGGRSSRGSLVATSGIAVPDGVPVVASGDVQIALWAYPNDPFLPGLATAANSERTRQLLSQLGIPAGDTRLRLRSYRPGRRAVIEVVAPRTRIFLKVVRLDRAQALQDNHASLATAVPVPHSHGWSKDQGLVALQAMPGKPLRRALESGTRKLPPAAQFTSLLDAFPAASTGAKQVVGPAARTGHHARLLKAVTPALGDRIDAIVERSGVAVLEDTVPVHGDFHSSQLLVRGVNVIGLIDVDTAGVGRRSDDLAVLLAHMSAVGLSTAARRGIDKYGAGLIKEFDSRVEPSALRRKVAAAILGFATGPFRVNQARWPAQTERRIALAERWIRSAEDV